MQELGGQAKAMLVTQSREHAFRYYSAIMEYVENNKYTGLRPLIAFSGELDLEGVVCTESGLNGFSEEALPTKFDGDEYQLLIVAEKYQTGFDQPKLCAMYIDRKLAGLQAVQTLSRINRIFKDKDKTFILDFQNTIEDIRDAFKPFFESTTLEDVSDLNQIYVLEGRIKKFGILDDSEINRFSEIYYRQVLASHDRITLEALLRNAVQRFEWEEDEGKREEFRQLLKSYTRFYAFVAQVIKLGDTDLEKLFSYASWLIRLLPNRQIPSDIEITNDMLHLQAIKVMEKERGSASLSTGDSASLSPISEFGAKPYTEDEAKSLSQIINDFNQRHGTSFTQDDFMRFERVNRNILNDDNLKDMLRNNPPDLVYKTFSQAFFKGLIELFRQDNDVQNIVMNDHTARELATKHFFSRAINDVRGKK